MEGEKGGSAFTFTFQFEMSCAQPGMLRSKAREEEKILKIPRFQLKYQQEQMSQQLPKFPVFGVLEPGNLRDEKVLKFESTELKIQIYHKEKIEKETFYITILAAVRDVLEPKYFTIYFNNGTLPWSFWCPTKEHCITVCGLLSQCASPAKVPNFIEHNGIDQLFCSTWVEKKGKNKLIIPDIISLLLYDFFDVYH